MAIAVAPDRLRRFFASEPEALADPGAVWREAREQGPVVDIGRVYARPDAAQGGSYLLTRYDDVRAAFRDPARFSNDTFTRNFEHTRKAVHGQTLEAFEEMWRLRSLLMTDLDDPEHARLRRIVHRAFLPRRIAELAAATETYVHETVDELARQGGVVDLAQVAYRVPLLIIGDLLGVPHADAQQIKEWSDRFVRNGQTPDERIVIAVQALRDLIDYIGDMIERHRSAPEQGDLVSALLGAEHDEVLTPEEVAASVFLFLIAGHETTMNLLAIGTLELLRRPGLLQSLREEPELIPGATEELLRHVSPVQWLKRWTTVDVEVAGYELPAESHVLIGLASANNDPEVFDEPDDVDIRRPNAGQHVSLGFGVHFCLGATLARLEGATLFRQLTQRFPDLELATETLEWAGPAQVRTLNALPVRLGREAG